MSGGVSVRPHSGGSWKPVSVFNSLVDLEVARSARGLSKPSKFYPGQEALAKHVLGVNQATPACRPWLGLALQRDFPIVSHALRTGIEQDNIDLKHPLVNQAWFSAIKQFVPEFKNNAIEVSQNPIDLALFIQGLNIGLSNPGLPVVPLVFEIHTTRSDSKVKIASNDLLSAGSNSFDGPLFEPVHIGNLVWEANQKFSGERRENLQWSIRPTEPITLTSDGEYLLKNSPLPKGTQLFGHLVSGYVTIVLGGVWTTGLITAPKGSKIIAEWTKTGPSLSEFWDIDLSEDTVIQGIPCSAERFVRFKNDTLGSAQLSRELTPIVSTEYSEYKPENFFMSTHGNVFIKVTLSDGITWVTINDSPPSGTIRVMG